MNMSGEVKITIGQRVLINTCEHEFTRLLPSSNPADERRDLQFVEVRTGFMLSMQHAEFDRAFAAGTIVMPSPHDKPGDELPEDENNEADAQLRTVRQELLRAFDENPVPKTDHALRDFLDRAAKDKKIEIDDIPAPSTFREWQRTRGVAGDRRRKHMGRRREQNGRRKRLDVLVEQIVKEESELYFKRVGVSAKDVYASARHRVSQLNAQRKREGLKPLRPASRTVVWRRLKANTNYANASRRFGARKAKLLFKPHLNYVKPTDILEVVIIDDTIVDCHIIDDRETNEDGKPIVIGRPRIAVAIDSFSRCVVGLTIDFKDPSVETAMACLRNIVRQKRDLNTRFPGLRGTFVWGGLPQTVLYDRAWGNVGSSMVDALEDIGVSVTHAPAATPEYKGIGERFFDTLNTRLFHKLPGAVPGKPHKVKELGLDPMFEARLTLDEIHQLLAQAVIDYNNDEHTGLGDIPARLWHARAKNGIQYPDDLRRFDMACAKLAPPLVLSSKGITLNGLQYCSAEIFDLLNDMEPVAPPRGRRQGTVEVKVKYFPEDLSAIFIWNSVRNDYVRVPCTETRFSLGLSEYQNDKLNDFRKQRMLAWSSEDDRCTARALFLKEATAKINSRLLRTRKQGKRATLGSEQFLQAVEGASRHEPEPVAIPSDGTLNRIAGETPERASVRKHKSKGGRRNNPPVEPANENGDVGDCFANDDRASFFDGFGKGKV
jgi:putative transposase